jgi:hypothetical protein
MTPSLPTPAAPAQDQTRSVLPIHAFLCANVDLAATEMGFKSKYSLEESIRSLF